MFVGRMIPYFNRYIFPDLVERKSLFTLPKTYQNLG